MTSEAKIVTVTLHSVIDISLVVPGFAVDGTFRATDVKEYYAGKGISCTLALAGLGKAANTHVLAVCGKQEVSQYIGMLTSMNVAEVAIIGGPDKTRRHTTILDPIAQSTTHVQVKGIPHPPDLFAKAGEVQRWLDTTIDANTVAALSGSLPPGAPITLYEQLTACIQAKGGKAILDTSGEALIHGLKAKPYGIKPNLQELETLTGMSLPSVAMQLEAAEKIRSEHGISYVAVSDGPQGCLLAGPDGAWHAKLTLLDGEAVINVQGCGDSLVAGWLSAIHSNVRYTPDVLRSMVSAATANLLVDGAGHLHEEMLPGLHSRVRVTKL
eukprot:m.73648 g.73648  ORF g.73648 m.73648 type:complete len:326 (-) comp12429_c0_seq2:236-1213(-)